MPNLSVKEVPEAWAEKLRQRAARHHRSLQGELMALIENAVREEALGGAHVVSPPPSTLGDVRGHPRIVGYDDWGWPIVRQGWKTPEQVFAEMRAAGLKPVPGQPLGVDIIREARDSR